jgi:hypothetical protein
LVILLCNVLCFLGKRHSKGELSLLLGELRKVWCPHFTIEVNFNILNFIVFFWGGSLKVYVVNLSVFSFLVFCDYIHFVLLMVKNEFHVVESVCKVDENASTTPIETLASLVLNVESTGLQLGNLFYVEVMQFARL